MTDKQRSKIVCRFLKEGKCTGTDCKFAHTDKVPGSAALVIPGLPANPKAQRYVVELMGDTGAGRHLGSTQAFVNQGIPEKVVKSASRNTQFPLQFETGGGEQGGKKTITLLCPEMKHNSLLYLLESCPLALSIGQVVNESGLPFVWRQVNYLSL